MGGSDVRACDRGPSHTQGGVWSRWKGRCGHSRRWHSAEGKATFISTELRKGSGEDEGVEGGGDDGGR